jgi:hypothetical protein
MASTAITALLNASTLFTKTGQYRPANWSTGPAMVSITVPASSTSTSLTAGTSAETPLGTAPSDGVFQLGSKNTVTSKPKTYVFDAVLDLEHEQRLEKTHHPIQTGADVSSHAYLLAARLTMNVLMSDVVAAYTPGSFTGSPSKSVSAYQTMLAIQSTRQPLMITTRLRTYTNMMIAGISPREDYKTITGLRMRVEFEQILTAATTTAPTSARPDDTASTGLGAVSPTPVAPPTASAATPTTPVNTPTTAGQNSSLLNQFGYPSQAAVSPYTLPANDMFTDFTVNVPGAGPVSSSPGQQSLPGLPNLIAM